MKKNDILTYFEELEKNDEVFNKWGKLYQIEDDIINSLISARKQKGMTQKDLAIKTGLKQSAIARIESGANSPQLNTLLNITEALNLDLSIINKCNDLPKNTSKTVVYIYNSNINPTYMISENMKGGYINENNQYCNQGESNPVS